MNHPKYTDLSTSSDYQEYRFISSGNRGDIKKLIQYESVGPNVYNLAFGDETESGEIDDSVYSNNGDIAKVMATVASTVYIFTELYPDMIVFFSGSNDKRTRFYKKAIARHLEELEETFEIGGARRMPDGSYSICAFDKDGEYDGFYAQRKKQTESNSDC